MKIKIGNTKSERAKGAVFILFHIIVWAIVLVVPFFPPYNSQIHSWHFTLPHILKTLFMCGYFYLNYCILIKGLLLRKRAGLFIVLNLCLIVLLATIAHLFFESSVLEYKRCESLSEDVVMVLSNSVPLIMTLAFALCIKMVLIWVWSERERENIEKMKSECELQNLKSQFNPHFLINTLNNIYVLIAISKDKAQEAVIALSKLLRYVLNVSDAQSVMLVKEVDFLKNYIELMVMRQRKGVTVKGIFDIAPESRKEIAPLLYISLVENAFKHGISPNEPSEIEIVMSETEKTVNCTIKNTYFPKTEQDRSGSGIGLELLSKRLEALYSGKYRYVTELKDGYYIVELEIELL